MSAWSLLRSLSSAIALVAAGGAAVADQIFLQSQHHQSRRFAIIEDDGKTAFLYLTEPGVRRPVKDAVLYTRGPLPPKQDWNKLRHGEPPQLSIDIASPTALVPSPKASELRFKWSADGESVAVLRKGAPLAMVSSRMKLGYSKAVSVASPLAQPWDQTQFMALFQR